MLMDKLRNDQQKQNEFKLLVNGNISYDLTDNLTLGNNSGIDYQTINQNGTSRYDSFNEYYFAYFNNQEWRGTVNEIVEDRMVFSTNNGLEDINTRNDLHSLTAVAYVEYIKRLPKNRSIQIYGLDPIFWSNDGSTGWNEGTTPQTIELDSRRASMLIQNAG